MEALKTRSEIREYCKAVKAAGQRLGLVPTMGALHSGHLQLVRKALADNEAVVVTIFVNPTQFDKSEDLATYPRTLEADLELLRPFGDSLRVFAPEVSEMYAGQVRAGSYDFGGLERVMEGAHRNGHFEGVGTIVEALLRLIEPDRAYFGEKDYQQLQIIRKLVDLRELPVEIIACPIIREADGLALSSRNRRLTKRLRDVAPFLHQMLLEAKKQFGTKSAQEVTEYVNRAFAAHPDFELEYFQIADAGNLKPVRRKNSNKTYRAFIAAYLGGVRLIDNLALN